MLARRPSADRRCAGCREGRSIPARSSTLALVLLLVVTACGATPTVSASLVGLAELGASRVFDAGVSDAVPIRDSRGALYVFAIRHGCLAVRQSADGGLSYHDVPVAGMESEAPAEQLAAASSTNMLATVYCAGRGEIAAIRIDPALGPTLLPARIGGGGATDLRVGPHPVTGHFLSYVRDGRLAWSVVDPVRARVWSGALRMPGEVIRIRSVSHHPESTLRLHVVLARLLVSGRAREALVAIDDAGAVFVQSERALSEIEPVAVPLGKGSVVIYAASGAFLRTAIVARDAPGATPRLGWLTDRALGFEPKWITVYPRSAGVDCFHIVAGDEAHIGVFRVDSRDGSLAPVVELADVLIAAAVAGRSLSLHRFRPGGDGGLWSELQEIDLSFPSIPEPGESYPLGVADGPMRVLPEIGAWGAASPRPRLLVEIAGGTVLVVPAASAGQTVSVSLPLPAQGVEAFRALAGAAEGDLLVGRITGGGLLLRYARDGGSRSGAAACAPFAACVAEEESALLLRCSDGSVWILAR